MIYYNCPHCQNSIRVSDSAAGRKGTCNQCGEVIRIPEKSAAETKPEPQSPLNNKRLVIGAVVILAMSICAFAYAIHAFSVSQIDKHVKNKYPSAPTETEPSAVPIKTEKIDITSVVLPDDYRTYKYPEDLPQIVDFDGKKWHYVGYANGVYGRGDMFPIMYTAGDRDERLIVEFPTDREQVYRRMFYEQKRVPQGDGTIDLGTIWVNDGLRENILLDGSKDRGIYKNKKPHGIHRTWYPNGQLQSEDTYYMGEMHGLARGWWENGNPQYESIYENGKEVSGKSFKKDGTER